MSLSIYVIFDNLCFKEHFQFEGIEIVKNIELLDKIAMEKNLSSLSEFDGRFEEFPEDFDGNPADLELPEEKWTWFDAKDGCDMVQVLIQGLEGSLEHKKCNLSGLLNELRSLCLCLKAAADKDVKFILAIS